MPTPPVSGPPVRADTDHVYYSQTKSLCATCKRDVDAKILFKQGEVWFEKWCPDHGRQEALVSSAVEWYLDALTFRAPNRPPARAHTAVEKGCPFDCGPCDQHQQRMYLPVIPITSACNLDCPICYTINKNEPAYRLPAEEMAQILERLRTEHGELDIINFTGGEPTLHPALAEFLQQCHDAGIRRLTVSTNGMKLLDEDYVRTLAALDARVVLSLDTLDPAVDQVMLGANTVQSKLKVLDLLATHEVSTTILPAVAAGLNDRDLPALLTMMLERPNICSLELHPLTFTGQGGTGFQRSARITIPDLHAIVETATDGAIAPKDFVPSPLAHSHCYSICYLLCLDGGGYVPFTRLLSRQVLYELLQDSLYIEPRDQLETVFRGLIDELWADPDRVAESERVLATLKRLINEMFPSDGPARSIDERRRVAERAAKAIYIHSHMDEETFDVSRIQRCCVAVPDPDGSAIPTCAYNVLYRERDPRFTDRAMTSAPAGGDQA